jgi:hypothetical protein
MWSGKYLVLRRMKLANLRGIVRVNCFEWTSEM